MLVDTGKDGTGKEGTGIDGKGKEGTGTGKDGKGKDGTGQTVTDGTLTPCPSEESTGNSRGRSWPATYRRISVARMIS